MRQDFPANFLLDTATAPYQIEGAWNEDGKCESDRGWRARHTAKIKVMTKRRMPELNWRLTWIWPTRPGLLMSDQPSRCFGK